MPHLELFGFDAAGEGHARATFARLAPNGWALATEEQADAILLDLDSMSGQMAWMKGFADGVTVIGVTTAPRASTPFRLPADFTPDDLGTVLSRLEGAAAAARPASGPLTAGGAETAAARSTERAPDTPQPPASPPSLARRIAEATTPFGVQVDALPRLVIDPQRQQFAPGKSLKALQGYATAALPDAAVTPLEPEMAEAALQQAGDPQPLARLAWLLALGSGDGRVLGHGAGTRFQLGKWPQVEREFPKHFRIATVMLKAPATVAEIALASGASEAEVADYVNAALAAGHASAS